MATAFDPRVRNLIVREASRLGLDPAAVLAVAAGEGGIRFGAVGDRGTSFGPFQLHWGGAMPKKYWGDAAASAAFANSPAGIAYALRQMAKAGAAGLQGPAAVETIVRKFERPADPDTSVQRAISRLGQFSGAAPGGPARAAVLQQAPIPMAGSMIPRQLFAQAFSSYLTESARRRASGQMPNFSGLMQLAQMRKAMLAANQTFGPGPAPKDVHGHAEPRPAGDVLVPPTSWKGTHVTDGLDWGTRTATDIMARPGTPVGAPEDGMIVRWDPEGAQGGGSMWFKSDSGRMYWLGHIAQGVAPGTRVRRGQPIAVISPDHPRPHLHIDVRGG